MIRAPTKPSAVALQRRARMHLAEHQHREQAREDRGGEAQRGRLGERQERQRREPAHHRDDADRGAQRVQPEALASAAPPGRGRISQGTIASSPKALRKNTTCSGSRLSVRWRTRLTISAKQQAAPHIQSAPATRGRQAGRRREREPQGAGMGAAWIPRSGREHRRAGRGAWRAAGRGRSCPPRRPRSRL